jgi:hypothetical protein
MASPGTVRTMSEKLRMLVVHRRLVMAVMLIGTRLIEVACFGGHHDIAGLLRRTLLHGNILRVDNQRQPSPGPARSTGTFL